MVHAQGDQCIGQSLKVYGEWAPGETAILNNLLKADDTVLDIGANVGFHSLFFSLKVGPLGKVLSFEPLAENYRMLTLNKVINNLDNVDLYQALVGAESKINMHPVFSVDPRNLGATKFSREATAQTASPLMQLKIDDLQLEKCNLLKIDVEGMEQYVLEGAQKTLEELRPVVFYEQNSQKSFIEIQEKFDRLNYQCFWSITKAFPKFNIRRNKNDIFKGNTESNILAVPAEKISSITILKHLSKVIEKHYSPPEISELPDELIIKSSYLSPVDVQWANFFSSFLSRKNI